MIRPAASDSLRGVGIAVLILGTWLVSLALLLGQPLGSASLAWIPPAVGLQTFLYTGLFITAHDSMHGTVCPHAPRLNRALGSLSLVLFALFSFRKLKTEHHKHHAGPGSADDPDFHDSNRPVRWYLSFMGHYVSVGQIVGMAIVFNLLHHAVGIALENLLLFWVLPSLLSTVQLFFFGTYLPHRREEEAFRDRHHARTSAFPVWLSFLTCYHFGYHWEHHEYPGVPWWKLPTVHRQTQQGRAAVERA